MQDNILARRYSDLTPIEASVYDTAWNAIDLRLLVSGELRLFWLAPPHGMAIFGHLPVTRIPIVNADVSQAAPGNLVTIRPYQTPSSVAIASHIASVVGFVTFTTSAAHCLIESEVVRIAGLADSTLNGDFSIQAVPSTTSFTIRLRGRAVAALVVDVTGTVASLISLEAATYLASIHARFGAEPTARVIPEDRHAVLRLLSEPIQ
jgi:hypothetical protein